MSEPLKCRIYEDGAEMQYAGERPQRTSDRCVARAVAIPDHEYTALVAERDELRAMLDATTRSVERSVRILAPEIPTNLSPAVLASTLRFHVRRIATALARHEGGAHG